MPIREFECPTCGHRVERLEFTPDPTLPTCERCATEDDYMGSDAIEMQKVTSVSSPQFRGDGWTRPENYRPPSKKRR